MRVISGTARRIQLKTVKGLETRPTTDRIKETLFNMINPYLSDCNFLDLFSGSGSIGIEALSRGANYTVFVENNKEAINVIKENLKNTRLEQKANVLMMEALPSLKLLETKDKIFDIIFMDPPYNELHEKVILEYLQDSTMIDENTIIIVEASLDTDFSYLENTNLQIYKKKEYKTNMHVFIEKNN